MEEVGRHRNESELPRPVVRRGRRISPIWLLPVIAAAIGGWLLYRGLVEAPIEVRIHFQNAAGIEAGKTRILYRGLTVGKVKTVALKEDLSGIELRVEFSRSSEPLLKEDTDFWMVTPQVKLTEVTGLETILAGNYIALRPGEGAPARIFTALSAPPVIDGDAPGLHLTLVAEELPSVQHGSPIYYRKLQVGTVQDFALAKDENHFDIRIHIDPRHQKLVNRQTRFWNASGVHLSGSLSNFEFRTESLTSLWKGGIGFFTPEHAPDAPPAKNGDRFALYADHRAARSGIPITIRFASAEGLSPGQSKVRFKGVEAGFVDRIRVLPDLSGVNVHVIMDSRAESALLSGTRFWLVAPRLGITGASGLETLTGGAYIAIQPGKGNPQRSFVALDEPPVDPGGSNKLKVLLVADRRGSLKGGSPVYYRQVKVGEIAGVELSKTADHVYIHAAIEERFAPLVRKNSRFWNVSGIGVDFGLFRGGQIKTDSVESILAGGVSFATPDNENMGERVASGAPFPLYEKPEDEWLTWRPKITL